MSLVSLKIIISEIQSCQKIEQGPVSLLKLINHRIHLYFGNATMFSQGNLKLKPKIETCEKKIQVTIFPKMKICLIESMKNYASFNFYAVLFQKKSKS